MSDSTFQELKELILALDKKVEVGFAEVKGEIKLVEERLTGRINQVEEKLTGRINQVEEKLTGRINQVEERLVGIDKRLGNEELVSRGVFIALAGGMITGLTKFFFFS
jgi:hypothetical protein